MCGIVGILDRFNNFSTEILNATVKSMSNRVIIEGQTHQAYGLMINMEYLSAMKDYL